MIDGYNRNINYLRISITDRCNLRCSYCMPKEGVSAVGHEDVLKYEEILRIVRIAVKLGITKVRITGGEPLVRRGVVDFIARLSDIAGLTDISLTTNGILLAPFAEPLFAAGIKRINISLDSLNEAKYAKITRGGELSAVLRGIEAVYQAGLQPIKINTVVIKGVNDDEILDFARLTLHKPFQIRFIELMPMGQAGLGSADQYISNDVIMERIKSVYRLEPRGEGKNGTDGPARMFKIKGGVGEIGFISPLSHLFCESCNRLRLTADGHLRACLLQDKDVGLREALRNGCRDEELELLMSGLIAAKPGQHEIGGDKNQVKKCAKEMSAIGG